MLMRYGCDNLRGAKPFAELPFQRDHLTRHLRQLFRNSLGRPGRTGSVKHQTGEVGFKR